MFTDVPVMAKKCRLTNIEPINDDGEWPDDALYFCTEHIVETQCHINIINRCDSNDVFPCSITTKNGEDLNYLLISENLAKLPNANKPSQVCAAVNDFERLKFNPDDLYDVMDYKEMFELTKVTISDEIGELSVFSPLSKEWKSPFELYDKIDLDLDEGSTIDKRTLSTSTSIYSEEIPKKSIIDRIKSAFEEFQLDIYTRYLVCEILLILDPLNVVIAPESPDHSIKYKEMMSYLQKTAPCLNPLNAIKVDSKCIAYSREDKLWKRALVMDEKLDSSNGIAVVFVDSLQFSTVSAADVRAFPEKDCSMPPLKYLEAQLYGLKPNRRLRSHDVANKLRNLILSKDRACIQIISIESKPQIEIYAKQQMNEVAYSSLIYEGFYSKLHTIPL